MNRIRRTVAEAAENHVGQKVLHRVFGKGYMTNVAVIRCNRYAGANEELAKNIRAMNFGRVGVRMMRLSMLMMRGVFRAMTRVNFQAQIHAPFQRPNRAGVENRNATQEEDKAFHCNGFSVPGSSRLFKPDLRQQSFPGRCLAILVLKEARVQKEVLRWLAYSLMLNR